MLAYASAWSAVTFLRHRHFHSGYDLATEDQALWSTAQGRPFATSIEVASALGDHVQPYLVALAPAYVLWPSPYLLLAFQSCVLAACAWPTYLLARRRLGSPAAGLAVAGCALAYPPLGFVNRFDFHPEVIAVPLLIAAWERVDRGRLGVASLLLGLTLLGKEDLGLVVAAFSLVVAARYGHARFGLGWVLAGMLYTALALFVVIPAFRGEPSDTLLRYRWLGTAPGEVVGTVLLAPLEVLGRLLSPRSLLSCLQLLAPLAFVPLAAPVALLPALPTLTASFLSDHPAQATIYNHYMAPAIPFLVVATVLGLERVAAAHATVCGDRLGRALVVLAVATLASWVYENPVLARTSVVRVAPDPPWQHATAGGRTASLVQPNDAALREGIARVPPRAAVLTTGSYLPHLSHRELLRSLPRQSVAKLEPRIDTLFLNLRDVRKRSCADYLQVLRAAAAAGFGLIFSRDGVVLAEKGGGDRAALRALLATWPAGCGVEPARSSAP